VPDDELIAAVGGAMVKVNIGTVRGTSQRDAALLDPATSSGFGAYRDGDTVVSVLRLPTATTTRAR
jgi:hypothetical protein